MSLTGTTTKATELTGLRTIARAANWAALPEAQSSQAVLGAYPPGSENFAPIGMYLHAYYPDLPWVSGAVIGGDADNVLFVGSDITTLTVRMFDGVAGTVYRPRGYLPEISVGVNPKATCACMGPDGLWYVGGSSGSSGCGDAAVYIDGGQGEWPIDLSPTTTDFIDALFSFDGHVWAITRDQSAATRSVWKKDVTWSKTVTSASMGFVYNYCVDETGGVVYVGTHDGYLWQMATDGTWTSDAFYPVGTRTFTICVLRSGELYVWCLSSLGSYFIRASDMEVLKTWAAGSFSAVYGLAASESAFYFVARTGSTPYYMLMSVDGVSWATVPSSGSVYSPVAHHAGKILTGRNYGYGLLIWSEM